MLALTPAELQSRLELDRSQLQALSEDTTAPVTITGHRSLPDAAASRGIVGADEPPPSVYRVVYAVPTLRGPGQVHRGDTVVTVDLLANGNYPYTPPVARVTGSPAPWTPHFHARYPICIGGGAWLPTGRRTAVDLVIHIGRLLNFDEPKPPPSYSGYNGEAIAWWAQQGYRSLDPGLVWPVLDPNSGGSRAIRSAGGPTVRSVRGGIRSAAPVVRSAERRVPVRTVS